MDENLQVVGFVWNLQVLSALGVPIWSCPLAMGTGAQGPCQEDQLWRHWVVSRPGPLRPHIEDTVLQKHKLRYGFSQKHRQPVIAWGTCFPRFMVHSVLTSRVHTLWTGAGRGEQS